MAHRVRRTAREGLRLGTAHKTGEIWNPAAGVCPSDVCGFSSDIPCPPSGDRHNANISTAKTEEVIIPNHTVSCEVSFPIPVPELHHKMAEKFLCSLGLVKSSILSGECHRVVLSE